jgi:hypothetical protein
MMHNEKDMKRKRKKSLRGGRRKKRFSPFSSLSLIYSLRKVMISSWNVLLRSFFHHLLLPPLQPP